jgi:hypothetical protein
MINARFQQYLILFMLGIPPLLVTAQTSAFELKKTNIQPNQAIEKKPLFDILETTTSMPMENRTNKWENNPFFKPPTPTLPEIKPRPVESVPAEMNLFEYKVTAIWTVNTSFSALISGHIVREGDRINDIKIEKISKKEVTVSRRNKRKSFRLGSIFYDFQI